MRAYKFQGIWMDLDHVLGISDVHFIDRMGHGGWYVEFEVVMMFRDKPLVFRRTLTDDEHYFDHVKKHYLAKTIDGKDEDSPSVVDPRTLLCVDNLQREVDILSSIWRTGAPVCVSCNLPYIWDYAGIGAWMVPCQCIVKRMENKR